MKLFNRILLVLCCMLAVFAGRAQDLHFSQFMNSPLTTNPANTGFVPEGDYRMGINYRNQWSGVMTLPYKTMSAYGDVQLMKNNEIGWLGVGGVILRDVAGSGNLTSTKVYGSVAYHKMLGYSSLLSAGFNVGWANKQINVSNLKFPDQFDGKFFDNKLPTSVMLDRNNISYLDVQAGMNYAYFPNENIYLNAGFSAHHVNRPQESFFTSTDVSNRIPVRYIGFLNGSFKIDNQWLINPNIYYTRQAGGAELVGGVNAHYNVSGDGQYLLIGGVYYRHKESVIPMIGLGYQDFTFSFTYDATISTMRNYNNTRGALEFSLIKQGIVNSASGRVTPCPSLRTY